MTETDYALEHNVSLTEMAFFLMKPVVCWEIYLHSYSFFTPS